MYVWQKMIEFRILVCGGRTYSNKNKLYSVLNEIKEIYQGEHICKTLDISKQNLVIIQGGAKGADRLALQWALENEVYIEQYDADWTRYGKAAGYIRNKLMLETGKPDLVIAFNGGQGTKNMIELAKQANVAVEIITD